METVSEFLDKLADEGVKLSVEAGQMKCYAPKGTLTPAIRDGIARFRTEIVSLLEGRERRPVTDEDRPASESVKEFPLSAGQKGLYILQKLYPAMSAYNVPVCFRIKGGLDAALLAKAWDHVLEQYPILTARVVDRDGALYQRLDDACRTTIQHQSIEFADDEQLLALLKERAKQPFDPNEGPLTRIELFNWGGQESVLLLTIHHLVIDGMSGMIVLRSFLEGHQRLCEGKPIQLSRDLPGYQKFVAWEEDMLASPQGEAHASYWRKQLEGELPIVELAHDRPDAVPATFEGKTLAEQFPEELSQWVREYGKTQSIPPSVIFLALFQLVLHRYSDQEDIIVGMPVMGRAGQKFFGDVGYFINMVPLRTRCDPRLKLTEFFRRVQATMLDALFHSSYPFPLMLETLQINEVRKDPVFQVTYAYQNFINQDTFAPLMQRQTLDIVSIPELTQEGESDLGLEVFEEGPAFSVKLKYNPELYTEQAIRRLFESYCAVLKGVSEDSDRPLHEYSIISGAEKERVLVDFNDTRAEYPKDQCLHELFVEQVAHHSGKAAVVCGDEQLTYEQLYDRSGDLALYLQSHGVKPDSLVGLCMDRSVDMLVGLLGIVRAGGAYVPLDPNYPDQRVAYTLEDSRAAIVLTQETLREKLRGLVRHETRLVSLDGQMAEIGERVAELKANGASLHQDVKPHHLAYVIYTSGSTGKPKGVAIEHHSPVTLVHWAHEVYSREELAGVLASTSICFDLSVFEIFVTLASGGTITLVPNALGLFDLPNRESVTLINTVPSAMEELVRLGAIPDSVLTVNLAGEPLSPRLVDKIYDNSAVKKVYDLYGPSEDTTYSTYVLRRKHGPQTIGRPIANTRVYILDPRRNSQPISVPGELYIAGDGLAREYLNRPELTLEKFVANPFEPGARMYRTGDRARWLDDGNIQYLGRIDTQVKIRGFRIEMGEIEVRLGEHAGIQDCAVVAQGEADAKQLVAFYRAKETTSDHVVVLPPKEIRAHLLQTLPDYMVPAAFVSLPAIPLHPNGKIDRRALARMEAAIASGHPYVAPRNETEQRLVAMWAEVLKRAPETIGVNDDFFELGGHSLLATQLVSRIHSQMGVDFPLKTVFDQTSVVRQAVCIAKAEQSKTPSIQPIDRAQFERLPLSFAEQRIWFVNQLAPEGAAAYSVPGAFVFRGELDLDQLDEAYNLIIARHETLRTIFPIDDGQTYRLILDRLDFKFQRTDLSQYDPDVRHARAKEISLADARTEFDLTRGPLIRGNVMKLAEHEHIVTVNMHHIISDGWSINVLVKEFRAIMDAFRHGRRPELPPLPIQYVDYSIWQLQLLKQGGLLEKQLAYWREKLAGLPESLDLTTDYPRPSILGFRGAARSFSMDAQLVADLKRLGERRGATLYMVLMAAFKALLHRYTGQNDICLGGLIANRNYGATEELIGMFVNNLALRSQVEGDDTFVALLSKVRATCLEAYENQDAPFPKVVDAMQLRRNTSISPLFQVLFFLQTAAYLADVDHKTQHGVAYFLETGFAKYEISVELMETPEGLDGSFEFNTDLYKPQTIARMIEHFVTLCRAVAGNPAARICDLDYMGEAEKSQALVELNAARADYPKDRCLHELFVEQVTRHSDNPAIVCGDEQLTYQQLYERSRDLALYLQSQGVRPDSLIGLCMDRSLDMVVGLLGILQAGGAYVPLDPNYPDDRLAYMVRDSQATIVLTQEKLREKLRGLVRPETRLVSLDGQLAEIGERVAELKSNGAPLHQDVKPHHLAYVIYTSGSTGQPKGVAIEHHSPVTLVHWAREVYSREELAGVLASTSICFDLSVFEIFGTLAGGGTIILVPNALGLLDLPNRESVTLINTVPSAMEELVRLGTIPDSVLTVNLAGEPLSPGLVDTIYDTTAVRKVYDLYGPSEATTYSTYVLRTKNGPQTIGRPIVNTEVYILDEHHHIQPIGVPGELYIAGDGLARGYLNRPELTQEKFVANPFEPGTRMYKTGDRSRWLDDGNIQYLGRIDTQVKVRGFRIELGEIEARLDQGIGILDRAVVAQGEGADKRLIAFYRAEGTTADHIVELPQEELRAHLLRALPDYMVPAAFVSVAAIPLTSNGKVDRRALEQMDVRMASGKEYVAPHNSTEEQLVEIWAEVLKLAPEKVGVYDSFFELGGHSLSAVQLISRINNRFKRSIPLLALFTSPNIAELAVVVDKAERSEIPPILPIDRAQFERLPLSFAEERVWFLSQLVGEGATAYSIPGAFVIQGELDLDQVDEALNLIIARHESLRTVFPSQDGQAQRRILDCLDFRLERIDVSSYETRQARDERAKEICQADAATPFDLASGPLIRGKVIKLAEDEHILMLNMHHIISDGWSLGVLNKELDAILNAFSHGRHPELPPLPIQYADFSVWQRRWLEESGVLNRQLAYWQEKLAGVPERLDVATDYPRPSVQRFVGATHAFTLDAQLSGQLKRLAEQQGGTLFMILLAVFKALLHRYTGQDDLCVGSPIANRQYGETEGLIGMFVNTLALRSHVSGDDPFVELLSKVKATCLEAYENQNAPFEKIVDMVRPQRNLASSPLFQAMLILQNVEMGASDPFIQRYPLESGISKFDLTIDFTETSEGLAGSIEYSAALYKPQTVARMVDHFRTLCEAVTAAPNTKIRDLRYIREPERQKLLNAFNDTRADYPREKCIHQMFAERVATDPDKTAVVFGERALSYRETYEASCDLALYLQSLGVGPDRIVGLCLERSIEMMVGIMGTALAGGAYLPLDPVYPDERLKFMLGDSEPPVVLTMERFRDRIGALASPDAKVIALDTQWSEIERGVAALKAGDVALRNDVRPHNLCYVIYTSGSTGKPKGVMVEHQALVNRIVWMQERYRLSPDDVVLQKTPYSFDVSVWEFFWPTMAGATAVFAVPEGHKDVDYLENVINEAKITTLHFVPSMLNVFLDNARAVCPSVRRIFCSGEALDRRAVDAYRTRFPNAALHNLYGPTEAAIDVTAYDCSQLSEPLVPIGSPISNIQIYILDRHNHPQPVGIPGELHIAGDGLARGYLNRPELTQEKFVANPFRPGTRMYRTGDLARWLDDGSIQYLGRIDTQVKVRGFRIELGEIEARLNQGIGILDSAVVARGEGADKRLIAFYRAEGTTADHIVELPQEELRAHLLRALPDYMVPTAFVSLAAIPLSSNGKVDRRALEQMDVTMASGKEYVAPRNSTEEQLVDIWAEVLKLAPEKVGIYDGFFELGGHSLSAVQLISRINKRFERSLSLLAIFTTRNVAELAVVVENAERSEIPPILPIDRAQFERLPLSFAEERVWFLSQLVGEGATLYSIPGAFVIRGELDLDQVDEALNLIIVRHESLRTVFPSQDGQAQRRILDRLDFRLERIDVSSYETRQERDERAIEICQADAANPFDLASGPLIRGKVIKLAEDEHVLMLNMHHIISDGWSLGVLNKELDAILNAFSHGRHPELAPLPIQYADFSVWQRQWLEAGGILARQLGYWQKKLAGVPDSLDLPTDHPRPSVQDVAGANYEFALDAPLTGQLKRLAEQQGGTLYMVLLAAFNVLLHRYTGQNDICVGTPIANRQYRETEGLIGMFVNTLALRTQVEGDEPFATLLSKVKATCLEAYEHQDAPFEKVVDALPLQRNLAITPLFQVMMILQNADMGVLDERIQRFPLDSGISKFDLTVEFTETPNGLAGSIRYRTALYEAHTIERMVRHLTALCQAITARPAVPVGELDYLDEAEKRRLLTDFNDTRVDYPNDKCLHELFAEQVAIHPDQPAVVFGEQELTYQELYQKSCDLASYLRFQGVKPDSLVGLYMERSLDMVVGLIGILQAGGAYVPLDPDYPAERLQYMLEDAAPTIVLTQERLKERLPKTLAPTIALDSDWAVIEEHARTNPDVGSTDTTPDNLAYVIYTSGSTGVPKGVMVRHGGVANLRNALEDAIYGGRADWTRVSVNASFSFDSSVKQFVQLLSGRTLILIPQDVRLDANALLKFISHHRIDVFDCTPSQLAALLGAGMFDGARRIPKAFLVGGEAIDSGLWRSLAERPDAVFLNVYGPAECTVDATVARITAEEPIPHIGRPVANAQIYILDSHGKPVPIGVVGEICIGGAGVGRGYLNRPELTAARFISNPFGGDFRARLYKTGDLGRWRADGNIEYVGRNDQQVKLRGQRIELGEIEAQLSKHAGVREAVVIAREDEPGEKRLVAYVTITGEAVGAEELRTYLLARLPQYMVPAAFVELEALPLTPNRKVDRKALPKPEAQAYARKEYGPPRGEVETTLAAIWRELLHVERVGRNDDFFELGGHSLSAVQLISRINKRFKRSLPLLVTFTSPNIAAFAKLLSGEETASFDILVPIQASGDAPPIFGIPGAGATVLSLQPLGRALGAKQPFYGLQVVGLDGTTSPLKSVEQTALANVAALKKVQARGPYRLIGHSYGGVVAYEMARLLLEEGEEVASLTLLDSIAPWVAQEQYEAAALHEADQTTANLDDANVKFHLERLAILLNDGGQEIDPDQLAAVQEAYRANVSCYAAYKPLMLPKAIDVSLYRAAQESTHASTMPDDYGWNRLLQSPIRIYDVEGDHYSMLKNVQFPEVGASTLQFTN